MLKKYLIVAVMLFIQQASAQTVNYVRTWDAKIPISDPATMNSRPVTEVMQVTSYVDGLGRPLQMIMKEGSFMNSLGTKTDMVTHSVYDAFGREVKKYMPYAAVTNNGTLKSDPVNEQYSFYSGQLAGQGETYFYSNSDIEVSPLNRITKTYAPGNSWVGSNRGVSLTYLNNDANDYLKIWKVNGVGSYSIEGNYNPGLLTEMHTTDESGNQVVEYKDKEGKVILKKVQVDGTVNDNYIGWLCTYYIYDDYNNLRLVLQPKAVKNLYDNSWPSPSTTLLDELAFRYEYDGKNRMGIKKVPGAAEVYMVYDKWDRLVLTQDGNLRSSNKWIFTKYDYLNRPVITGFYTDATHTGQSGMQSYVDGLMLTAGRYESTNSSTIGYTTTASFPSISSPALLSISFYDNYLWTSNYNSNFADIDITFNGLFYGTGSPLYAQSLTKSDKTKGMMTGTVTYILNRLTTQKLVTSIIYDDRGRAIQSKSQNITGGTDITTTQYNFSGQPLMSLLLQEKAGSNAQTIRVITKLKYDDLARLEEVRKNVIHIAGSVTTETGEKLIVKNEYDKLGQLVTKNLAPAFANNTGLEKLNYEYNVRGWMTEINKDYLNGSSPNKYFGMELAYDKTGSAVSGTSYAAAQYNGNITGTIWKTKGNAVNRQYDFAYDNVNRLLKADFKQKNPDNNWNNSVVNYNIKMGNGTDYTTAYDENGNIKKMQQWGLKINTNPPIDNLTYEYANSSYSNKLVKVTDANSDPLTKLGDFKDGSNGTNNDYSHDVNGNMVIDYNKKIVDLSGGGPFPGITYNHLNLPQIIKIDTKGTIEYVYDAAGNKLRKIVSDFHGGTYTTQTTTTYLSGSVYEGDVLQFVGHEEGRVRFKPAVGSIPAKLNVDYFIKDHLGNVRMVLTDEAQQDMYPAATMETATAATEEIFYSNLPATRVNPPANYPTNTPAGNAKVARVSGGAGGSDNKIGPAMVLKVMAGDKFNVTVNSWYKLLQWQTPDAPTGIVNLLLGALNNGVGGLAEGKGSALELAAAGAFVPGANTFLTNQTNNSNSSKPKAFLNWILFDEQFNYVSSSSGFEQVGASDAYTLHVRNNMSIDKSGFLYIYVSNETPNIDVFFDNLQVTHIRGQILEETHYYPFGLTMVGISSKAAGKLENKRKWNVGSELNTDFDVNLYETFYRNLDPQIGRFWQVDPKPTESESPYVSMGDNPIINVDPKGDYFFGLFGSTKEQRKSARALAEATGGEVHNITSKNVSVSFAVTVDTKTSEVSVGVTHFYQDGFPKILGKAAHLDFLNQSFNRKYGGKLDPATGRYSQGISSGRIEMVDDPFTMLGPGLLRGLFTKLTTATITSATRATIEEAPAEIKWLLGASKSEAKWASQLSKRGWTPEQITDAITKGEKVVAQNSINPANGATRYIHPTTGQSVVLDNVTNEVIHVGGPGFKY